MQNHTAATEVTSINGDKHQLKNENDKDKINFFGSFCSFFETFWKLFFVL